MHMTNYTTLGHNLKRGIFRFSEKISKGMYKPEQKFITEMIYGLIAGKSCFLTEIARKLHESVTLKKTVERLSRNLTSFEKGEKLRENYFNAVKGHFNDDTILISDDSDISKRCSRKLEGLCKVRDGSTGEIADGYWYAGVSALTAKRRQPIPVYGRVYSGTEDGYSGNNSETLKSLEYLSSHFPKNTIRAFDRGYDAGYVFDYLIARKEAFVVRMNDRIVLHKGEKVRLKTLAGRYKGKYALAFKAKNGKTANCKISIVPVSLPDYPDTVLNLVICNGLGKEPLLLLTSLDSSDRRLCVTITKVYLMRWRIEEYYKFKKQSFGFEKFLVRSLKSIRNLDMLLSIAIGYLGILSEQINESVEVMDVIVASKRLSGLSKFTFYAIVSGLAEIFAKLSVGISSFFKRFPKSNQLCLPGWS
jgi:hypothetical protein